MKRSFFIVGIIALLIFGMSLASFGDNQWVSIGPGGVTVKAIAINPQAPETLYIGTAGFGVFKSIDGGANWIPASTGLTTLDIMALGINPDTPDTTYVGTAGKGIFRSIDGGTSWVNAGLPSAAVDAITIDPLIPTTVFIGTGGGYGNALYYGDGAFKSIDGGSTWTSINNGLPVGGVTALAVNPQAPEIVFAGADRLSFDSVFSVGVLKSSDGGKTWIPTTLTEREFKAFSYVFALVIDPQTPETIYAGTTGNGVFKSIDGGATWTTINTGLPSLFVYALAINPQIPDTLYAATYIGVFRSVDGGTNWVGINAGLPISRVDALAINPQTPEVLYAGTHEFGLFKINVGAGPINPALTVLKSGTGTGTVTSDLPGINCGTACRESYDSGTVVTLATTPEPGSTFVGWSGECTGTGTCLVTMDNDTAVVAIFDLQGQHFLRITKSGTGSGTVTSNTGVDCGTEITDCIQSYSQVQRVRLMAKPDDDSIFGGWSGGTCSGTGTCEVTVDSPTLVTANFIKKIPEISVSSTSIDFGDIKMGRSMRKRLAITNNGTGDLTVVAGGLEGTDFSISGKASVKVKPKRTIHLSVVFRPTSQGQEATLLEITSNDPDKPLIDVPLTGTSGPGR